MSPYWLMSLVALVSVASFDMSMAGGKFEKNRNDQVIPKRPAGPPGGPLVVLHNFKVEIHNDLRMFLLDSHCFSKDNNLGLHILFPDEQQDWSFTGNWLGTTRFTCKLEWENGYLEFDVFYNDADFLTNYCGNSTCAWSARQDGIYLADKNGQYVFKDYWEMLRK